MLYLIAGRSLVGYGLVLIFGSVAYAVATDRLTVDLSALVAIWCGVRVGSGSRSAARLAIGLMAIHLLLAWSLAAAIWISPEAVRIAGRPPGGSERPWVAVAFIGMSFWAAFNAAILWKALSPRHSVAEGG